MTVKFLSAWSGRALVQWAATTRSSMPSPSMSAVSCGGPGIRVQVDPNCFWMKSLFTLAEAGEDAEEEAEDGEAAGEEEEDGGCCGIRCSDTDRPKTTDREIRIDGMTLL